MSSESLAATATTANYNIPSVLGYLQQEYCSYERDKLQWELQRNVMMTRISLLEGENLALKNNEVDLIKRLKMLELVVKRLRGLSDNPVDSNNADDKGNNFFGSSINVIRSDNEGSNSDNSAEVRQNRLLIKHYLTQLGYTDDMIDTQAKQLANINNLRNELDNSFYSFNNTNSQKGDQNTDNTNNNTSNYDKIAQSLGRSSTLKVKK